MKLHTLVGAAVLSATSLIASTASAALVSGSTQLGLDFDLGISGANVTELGVGALFASDSFDNGEKIKISIYDSEGGTFLGSTEVENTFGFSVGSIGYSFILSTPGLFDGVGFAVYESTGGSFDLTGGTFNSFAPVVQTNGVVGTNLRELGASGPGTQVPEPASLALVLAGLWGAAGMGSRKQRKGSSAQA